jgi:hypothetical protein
MSLNPSSGSTRPFAVPPDGGGPNALPNRIPGTPQGTETRFELARPSILDNLVPTVARPADRVTANQLSAAQGPSLANDVEAAAQLSSHPSEALRHVVCKHLEATYGPQLAERLAPKVSALIASDPTLMATFGQLLPAAKSADGRKHLS